MNRKFLGVILIIIGLVSLIGAGLFAWMLVVFSDMVGALSAVDATTASQYGLDLTQVQSTVQTINTITTVAFLWIITVIISSICAIYFGIERIRKK